MSSAEGLTIVEQESAIGGVERGHPHRKTLTERLSQRTIEGCVRLQVFGNVAGAIHEPRSVIQIAGSPCPERQRHIEVRMHLVALIVIANAVAAIARREVRQPARNCALTFN